MLSWLSWTPCVPSAEMTGVYYLAHQVVFLLQAESRPLCASYFLDSGLWGCLYDAFLVWSESSSGAALPQFPLREGCCAVSSGMGSFGESTGKGFSKDNGMGQDSGCPTLIGYLRSFRWTRVRVSVNVISLGLLQLLLCSVPLPASGPLYELPHWSGHVCLL